MDNRYSFIDLFSKKVDYDKDTKVQVTSIIIPQIQRPYAQGRTDGVCTYIRNKFLDEIFENLSSDTDKIFDLNFIYGIIKPNNEEYKLELLDGQQRLTTLFLLYWYIVNAELTIDQEENQDIRDCLARFLYETRTTSTVFCQELAAYKVDLDGKYPKEVIRNSKWYFKSFDRDSTISAMLTMLDSIHERYTAGGETNLFTKLQNIQFYVKSLGVFNLSEELYIKMNARGLQLSPFENFKADLTHFVSNTDYASYNELVPLYKKGTPDKAPFYLNFSVKLDAKWVDIFWNRESEDFDSSYMSFFSRFFACKYIIASKDEVSDRDMRADKNVKFFYTDAEEQIGNNEYFGFRSFEKLLKQNPKYLITLDKVLDVLYDYGYNSDEKHIYQAMLPIWEKTSNDDGDDFYRNASIKMTHVKLIAFAAVIEYIEAFPDFDCLLFKRWMRVVWNIIENTNIDSLTPVSSLIRKFSTLIHFIANKMADGKSFFNGLSEWRNENSTERENRALIEEVEKAKRISEEETWENLWIDVENHPYFRGMATFFYNSNMTQQEFSENSIRAKEMFDTNGISQEYQKKHILIRAIVSQFNSWDEVNELYVTERSEKNKFLKNILAANEKVRIMLTKILYSKNVDDIKSALKNEISNAEEPIAWQNADENGTAAFKMAIKRLRNDIKMYDWISQEELNQKACFRIYWYEGHIMFAVPRKQYAKIALDTERAEMAKELCISYGFSFNDNNQEIMYNTYKDCFGNIIWLKQIRKNCTLWIGFDQHHVVDFQIECKTKKYANELLSQFEGSNYIDADKNWVKLPTCLHYSKAKSFRKICKVIENIFNIIPE